MTATRKEENNLNYQEIKCVIVSLSVTNSQTLKFDYLRLTKK